MRKGGTHCGFSRSTSYNLKYLKPPSAQRREKKEEPKNRYAGREKGGKVDAVPGGSLRSLITSCRHPVKSGRRREKKKGRRGTNKYERGKGDGVISALTSCTNTNKKKKKEEKKG